MRSAVSCGAPMTLEDVGRASPVALPAPVEPRRDGVEIVEYDYAGRRVAETHGEIERRRGE